MISEAESTKKRIHFSEVHLNLDFAIHLFCFLSVLFIGADRFGLNIGVNLRLDQVFLLVLSFLLLAKGGFRITANIWILIFFFGSTLSVLLAFNLVRGMLFYFSILYNIVFLFYGISSYIRIYGMQKFLTVLRKSLYCQFYILVIQFLLKVLFGTELSFLPSYGLYEGIPRFQLWFYEPSYLATYICFWFALSWVELLIGKDTSYIKDIIYCFLMFVISTATTGFVAIAITLCLVYCMWLGRGVTFRKIMFLFVAIFLIIIFRFAFSSLWDVFIDRLFIGSLDTASGGRISGWDETLSVYLENPLLGVGPGCYGLYLGKDAGAVPTNVTLELMATLGIVGTIAFYGLTVSLIIRCVRCYKKRHSRDGIALLACAVGLIIFTIILQINQGYLRLYHWMFFGMIAGGLQYVSKKEVTS